MTESKYLEFYLLERKPRTTVWQVKSKHSGDILGVIKWFGKWRQYAFFPWLDTIWNPDCMTDIIQFIRELMDKRKKEPRP